MTQRLIAAVTASAAVVVLTGAHATGVAGQAPNLPPELTKAIAYYATLTSYADTGTIEVATTGIVDTSRFETALRRKTRDLYIEHQALKSVQPNNSNHTLDMSAHRYVIWMFKGEMQTYEFVTGNHESINGDAQARTIQGTAHRSQGSTMLILSLIYAQARLPGAISQIEEATVAGIEEVDKRRCHKVVGVAAAYYPSGQRTNIRPVTVWIDTETQLIRKVFEDTPKGYPARSFSRRTTTLQPQANPALDDKKFQFKVPG